MRASHWTRILVQRAKILHLIFIYWAIKSAINVAEYGSGCTRCEMTVMAPRFIEQTHLIRSEFSFVYRFFRYHDALVVDSGGTENGAGNFDQNVHYHCVPVLFVPGSVGSYRQVRSLASTVLAKISELNPAGCYGFYTVDFSNEFSAFSAPALHRQAVYVNDVCSFLVSRHHNSKSIVLVGHSFGGIVIRATLLQENFALYDHQALMVTFATPHLCPPINVSLDMAKLYESIQRTWSSPVSEKSRLDKFRSSSVLLSVWSGNHDILVPSETCQTKCAAHQRCLDFRPKHVPGVWSDPNHQAVVWEFGIISAISKVFAAIVDGGELKSAPLIASISQEILLHKPQRNSVQSLLENTQAAEKCRFLLGEPGRPLSRQKVCDGQQSNVCVVFKLQDGLQLVTAESLGSGFDVALAKEVQRIDEDTLQLGGWLVLSSQNASVVPGISYKLQTVTETATEITGTLSVVDFEPAHGHAVLRYSCNPELETKLFYRENGEWMRKIAEWEEIQILVRGDLVSVLRGKKQKKSPSFNVNSVFNAGSSSRSVHFTFKGTEGLIPLNYKGKFPAVIIMRSSSGFDGFPPTVALVSQDGSEEYPVVSSGQAGWSVPMPILEEHQAIRVMYTTDAEHSIEVRVDFWACLHRLAVYKSTLVVFALYCAMLLRRSGLSMTLFRVLTSCTVMAQIMCTAGSDHFVGGSLGLVLAIALALATEILASSIEFIQQDALPLFGTRLRAKLQLSPRRISCLPLLALTALCASPSLHTATVGLLSLFVDGGTRSSRAQGSLETVAACLPAILESLADLRNAVLITKDFGYGAGFGYTKHIIGRPAFHIHGHVASLHFFWRRPRVPRTSRYAHAFVLGGICVLGVLWGAPSCPYKLLEMHSVAVLTEWALVGAGRALCRADLQRNK